MADRSEADILYELLLKLGLELCVPNTYYASVLLSLHQSVLCFL